MEKVENSVNKYMYKVFLFILRGIPYIIALCYIIFTTAFYFCLELNVIGYIGSCSILTWLFLYISSFVFRFCKYHRIPLYYVFLNDIINIIDTYIGLPISTNSLFVLHIVLIGIIVIIYSYLRIKCK